MLRWDTVWRASIYGPPCSHVLNATELCRSSLWERVYFMTIDFSWFCDCLDSSMLLKFIYCGTSEPNQQQVWHPIFLVTMSLWDGKRKATWHTLWRIRDFVKKSPVLPTWSHTRLAYIEVTVKHARRFQEKMRTLSLLKISSRSLSPANLQDHDHHLFVVCYMTVANWYIA